LSTVFRVNPIARVLAIGCSFLCFFVIAGHDAWSEVKEKRSRVVIPEKAYEFGTVSEGTIVVHDFEVRNIGTADLSISRIAPTCGCTAATLTSPIVPPGKSEMIRVQFDTAGFSGSKFKQVHVRTSDRDVADFVLTLRGTIVSDVKVEPAKVDFGELARSSSLTSRQKEFVITIAADSDRKVQRVAPSSKFLQVEEIARRAKTASYRVRLLPSAPLGELRERVVVSFAGADFPALNVPVIGRIVGDVRIVPATVSFGLVSASHEVERRIQWQNMASKPIRIVGVSSSDSAIRAELIDIQPGKQGVIVIKLDPRRVARDLRATVTLKTDSIEQPEVLVPVYGVKPPQ
jgi:hypothetical protein